MKGSEKFRTVLCLRDKACDWVESTATEALCSLPLLPWHRLTQQSFSWLWAVRKTERWFLSTGQCAFRPSHHRSGLLFHARWRYAVKAFFKIPPKSSTPTSPFCCLKGGTITPEGFDLLLFLFLNMAGQRLDVILSSFWEVEWLMLKSRLKRHQIHIYAESSQVQIASKSPCQVIVA